MFIRLARLRHRASFLGMACAVKPRFKGSRRAVKLDDTSFNAAIFANLFGGEGDTYKLVWWRGRRQNAD
jgi:uncharacterized protein (DUF736 family)